MSVSAQVSVLGIIIIFITLEYQWIMQMQAIAPRFGSALRYLLGEQHRARDYLYVKTWFHAGYEQAEAQEAELTRMERQWRYRES